MGFNRVNSIDGVVLGGVTAGTYRQAPWHVKVKGQPEQVTDKQGRLLGVKRPLEFDLRTVSEIGAEADLLWEPKELSFNGATISVLDKDDPWAAPENTTIVSDKKMLVRPNWPSKGLSFELGTPSETYGTLTNEVGLSFVAEILKHRPDALLRSATTLYGGKIVFVVVEFPENVQVTRRNGDTKDMHTPFMGIYWSHDGSHPLGVKYMRHEWVCENTFTPWNAETGLVIRHTRYADDRAKDALRAISGMMKAQDQFDLELRRLIEAEITKDDFRSIVRGTIGKRPNPVDAKKQALVAYDKKFEAIVAEWKEFTDGATAFDAVMAVQGYEQHRQEVRGGGRDIKTITKLMRDNYPLTAAAAKAAKLVMAP